MVNIAIKTEEIFCRSIPCNRNSTKRGFMPRRCYAPTSSVYNVAGERRSKSKCKRQFLSFTLKRRTIKKGFLL
jgi:hypothetical protein